ncbi:MAG: hypothetical protein QOJ80_4300, partial [Mycobacterium sp.]|nr:hypothetical protein [Mycobacterium sp.]
SGLVAVVQGGVPTPVSFGLVGAW